MASPPRGRWAEDPGLAGGGIGGPATVCGRSTIENLVAYYRDIEQGELDEEKLIELWQKTNGLHAVEEWVTWPLISNARTGEKAKEISKSQIPIFPNFLGLVLGCIEAKFCK